MEEFQRQLGVIGLAKRAGALAVGTNNVLDAVRKKTAKLVLVASDVSENTAKQLTDKCAFRSVDREIIQADMHELGHAVGKDHTAAVAFLQERFISAFRKNSTAQTTKEQPTERSVD